MFEDFDMEGIIDYLMEGHGEWTHQANSELPLKFNTAIMFSMAKMWMQLICTRLVPTHNAYRAVMLYFILHREGICVGHWIYEAMLKCI